MRAVVTGAGGFIGRALVGAFRERGAPVTAVLRTRPAGDFPVPWEIGELGRPLPEKVLAGADRVVHLAHDLRPGQARTNVEGTKLWFQQARRAGVPTQVYLSSCSAHPASPSEYGQTKFELEAYVQGQGGLVVRPGLVVGDGGMFGDLIAASRRWPLFPVLGGDELRVFLTGLHDLLTLLVEPRPGVATVNAFSPEPMALRSVVDGVRRHLGLRGLTVAVPLAVARPLLALATRVHASDRRYHASFLALVHSQGYGYQSSYPALGMPPRALSQMLDEAFSRADGRA
jgi:nucleoside-diphosphate-sugar epimerase